MVKLRNNHLSRIGKASGANLLRPSVLRSPPISGMARVYTEKPDAEANVEFRYHID